MWKGLRSGCLQLCIRHSKLCKAWNTVIVASFEEALVKNTMLRARVELTSFSWEVMCLQIWYPGNRFTQIIKKKPTLFSSAPQGANGLPLTPNLHMGEENLPSKTCVPTARISPPVLTKHLGTAAKITLISSFHLSIYTRSLRANGGNSQPWPLNVSYSFLELFL